MKEALWKIKRMLQKERRRIKTRKTKRLEYAQRQGKKRVVGSQIKDACYRKAEQKKIKRQMKNASLKIDWGEKKTATSKQTDEH